MLTEQEPRVPLLGATPDRAEALEMARKWAADTGRRLKVRKGRYYWVIEEVRNAEGQPVRLAANEPPC